MSSPRPLLAFDLDEVVGEFVAPLCSFHNEAFGTSLSIRDFHGYEFFRVWGGTAEESTVKVQAFFRSPWFLERIKPLPGAFEVLKELQLHFDLCIVTSRQLAIAEVTKKWVNEHMPGIFTADIGQPAGEPAILFGNAYGLSGPKQTKADLCRQLGRCIALVDDQEKYAIDVGSSLLTDNPAVKGEKQPGLVVLFGDYKWQKWQVHDKEPPADYADKILTAQRARSIPSPSSPSPSSGAGAMPSDDDAAAVERPSGVVRVADWEVLKKVLLSLAGVRA